MILFLSNSARGRWGAGNACVRLMVLLLIALFYHTALGLQVVIEDYTHSDRVKIPTLVIIRLGCFALAVAGIISTLRIAFDD